MDRKTGFTLLELLIVVIILCMLAILAAPRYQKYIERTKAKEAISILNVIAIAQQSYRIENARYFPLSGSNTNLTAINSALGINISNEDNWNYTVILGSPAGDSYSVTAHRQKGSYSSCEYNITVTSGSNTVIPQPTTSGNCP